MDDTDKQFYLNEHSCSVSGVALTNSGKLISADVNGKIIVWKDFKVYKTINDFKKRINTISEINEGQQRIAILSFHSETVKFYDLRYSEMEPLTSISNIKGSGCQNNMLKLNNNILAIAGTYIYIIDLNTFMVTNTINCVFANDTISTSLVLKDDKSHKGFFFIGQALTSSETDENEKGTIGYYEYDFNNPVIPDNNPLYKIGSKVHAHDNFITSIRSINFETFVTGSMDGKIKFWKIVEI
jgi:WD40 repeat protein